MSGVDDIWTGRAAEMPTHSSPCRRRRRRAFVAKSTTTTAAWRRGSAHSQTPAQHCQLAAVRASVVTLRGTSTMSRYLTSWAVVSAHR